MKRKFIVPALCISLILLFLILFWSKWFGSQPVLVFKGFDKFTSLQHAKIFKFELRNKSREPIWFCAADQSPFNPKITEPSLFQRFIPTTRALGFSQSSAMKLAPNDSITLAWVVLDDGTSVKAGAAYYFGDFKDEADFLAHCFLRQPASNAPWKSKLRYYWQKYGAGHRRHVIAWSQPVTFHTENPKKTPE